MIKRTKKLSLSVVMSCAFLGTTFLSGCTTNTIGQAERVSESSEKDITRNIENARQPLPTVNTDPIQIVDDVWTSGSSHISQHGDPLPARFQHPDGFMLRKPNPMTLFQIGPEITRYTGISVEFSPDIFGDINGKEDAGSKSDGSVDSVLSNMGVAAKGAGGQASEIMAVNENETAMRVSYTGNLADFLSQVSSYFSVSWEYRGGSIHFFKSLTRTYTLNALASDISMHSTLTSDANSQSASSGGQSSAASGGNSSSDVKNDIKVSIWTDIVKTIEGLVGKTGHVNAAISTGSLTVTAPPEMISKVDEFIEDQNRRLSKQVTLSVQLLNVNIKTSDNNQFDMQMIAQKAAQYGFTYGTVGGQLSSALTSATGAINSLVGNTSTTQQPGFQFGVLNPNSPFYGTTGYLQMLASLGKITTKTSAVISTPNGVPAQVQVQSIRGYLYMMQTMAYGGGSSDGSASSQTTMQPGSVTVGFSMAILPRVNMDGSGVLLQFSSNMSELNGKVNGFDQISSGNEMIQLPNINSRNFNQQIYIPTGSSIAMTGFEQIQDTANESGVGDPHFYGLGGSQSGIHDKNMISIIMTPQVSSINNPIQTH